MKLLSGLLAVTAILMSLTPTFLVLGSIESFFPVDSSPYGKPYQEWMKDWWKWYVSANITQNPNFMEEFDPKKVDCLYNQENSSSPVFYLWFFNGDLGQNIELACTIPEGKAIAVPIDLGLMDFHDDEVNPKTEEELRGIVRQSNIDPVEFEVSLDGRPISFTNDESNRVTTDLFNISLPANNLWYQEEVKDDPSVADGWLLLLKPLPPGEHVLKYTGGYLPGRNTANYVQDVTYNLDVK
jgi:hypothetical protein